MPKYKIHWTEIRQVSYHTEIIADNKISAQKMLFHDTDEVRSSVEKVDEDCFDYISKIKIEEIK
jgi:hypothetical protein